MARDLGFAAPFDNSLDVTSDRDFVAELLNAIALLGVHLSRIGEEVVLWSTEEFGFLKLADAYSTGSSMLPQKKNPDIAELARGKAGRLIGHAAGLSGHAQGPARWPTTATCRRTRSRSSTPSTRCASPLPPSAVFSQTATFDLGRMADAADAPTAAAIDLAEWLVERGTPFREAHAIVGGIVRDSLERHVPMAELVEAHPALGAEAVVASRHRGGRYPSPDRRRHRPRSGR